MQILFTISVLSFFGIVWAAIAFARHIKAGQLRNRTNFLSIVPARPDFKHHLFNASLQSAPSSTVPVSAVSTLNAPLSTATVFTPRPSIVTAPAVAAQVVTAPAVPRIQAPPTRTTFVPEIGPALRTRGMQLHQSAKDITAKKQWTMPPQSARPQRRTFLTRTPPQEPAKSLSTDRRKPPLPARHGTMELLDRAYFSKDLGDLTDPYQTAPVRVNERAPSASSRKF